MAVGLWCIAVGALLTVGLPGSLAALAVLVTLGLVLTGLVEVAEAIRTQARLLAAAGAGRLAAGVTVAAWPGVTVRVVAAIVGVSLIVGGAIRTVAAVRGTARERVT